MKKRRVTIQFSSLTRLWEFRLAIDANVFGMNLKRLTLITYCTEEQIQFGMTVFNGKLVEHQNEDIAFREGDQEPGGTINIS